MSSDMGSSSSSDATHSPSSPCTPILRSPSAMEMQKIDNYGNGGGSTGIKAETIIEKKGKLYLLNEEEYLKFCSDFPPLKNREEKKCVDKDTTQGVIF